MMDTLKMDIDALLGERWFPKETSFEEDITEYWGEWGVCSEVETLRAVLMRRPGKEVESFDPKAVRFSDEPIDVELMRRQHDNVAKVYTDFGAKVYYVEHLVIEPCKLCFFIGRPVNIRRRFTIVIFLCRCLAC